jgi:hypothetical protein
MAKKKKNTRSNDPYLLPDGFNVWERCPWDTGRAYDCFLLYYFPQKPKRNLNKAYRDATPNGKPKSAPDMRTAPSNWRRWAGGRDTQDRQLTYQISLDDGGISKVFPVPTWEQRAAAWDSHKAKQAFDNWGKERDEIAETAQKIAKTAMQKLETAWASYAPGPGESLRDLAAVSRELVGVVEKVFGLFGDDEKDALTEKDFEDKITDIERVNQAGSIILRAAQRKAAADKESKK